MRAVIFNQKGKGLQLDACVFSLRTLRCFDTFLTVTVVSSEFCYFL